MDTIYALWRRIINHPDFAGGTCFTRDDVAKVLFGEFESAEEEQAAAAAVTDEHLAVAQACSDDYFDDHSWWFELLDQRLKEQSGQS